VDRRSHLPWRAARLAVGVLVLAWALPAQAVEIPFLHDIFVSLRTAGDQMTTHVANALVTPQIKLVMNTLFMSLAVLLFVWKFAGFALRGFDLVDALELSFSVFFVYIMLSSYTTLVQAIATAGSAIGDALGGAISGADDNQTLAESIFSLLLQLTLLPKCGGLLDCIKWGWLSIQTVMVADIAILLLGVVATVVEVWMHWSVQIAYGVGWVTIPLLLVRSLSFLFDGWLKFFLAAIFYDIIAKVTLAMVLLSFRVLTNRAPGANGATIEVHGPMDIVPLFLFIFVGVILLTATGKLANAVVAGTSGVGGVLQDLSRGAAQTAAR
jgi:hypothetical protein